MRRMLLSAILALTLTTGMARADVITTYTLSNVTTLDGATVTGSFKIDQTTYNNSTGAGFDGGSLTVSGDAVSDFNGTYSFDRYLGSDAVFDNSPGSTLDVAIGNPPFTTGSEDLSFVLVDSFGDSDAARSGTITAMTTGQTAVREPPSLALLAGGLGLLGFVSAGTFLRRALRAVWAPN